MQCTICQTECPDLGAQEQFCGECGHPASAHGGAVSATAEASPAKSILEQTPAIGAPPQRGTYNAEISREHPGCMVFLIDHSGSMDEPIAGGSGQKKKHAVADAINRLLGTIILRCSKEEGVRHYFDIGVWTYSGKNDVRRVFDADLLSTPELEKRTKRREVRRQKFPDGAGGIYEQEIEFPIWLDPTAQGETPMKAAFQAVMAPLQNWVQQHPDSFPPVVIHLTDGHYTGENPAPVVWKLMQLGTADGNALVFNCHISKEDRPEVLFPGPAQAALLQGLQRELFDLSSPLPEPMGLLARDKGYTIMAGARGYVYNAKQVTVSEFLDIGTRAVQERMEGT